MILCVFSATIFWFFNALNKTYTTNINFPLSFDYDRENFIPVEELPNSIRLNVTGNGWELFKRSTGVKSEALQIPLVRPAETKKIVGTGFSFAFANQLNGLEVNRVLSDTLYVDLEPRIGRWIKLTVDSLIYNIRSGYGLASDVAIMPDSTFIEGPKRIVEKIREPLRLTIPQRNIDEQYIQDIEVELPREDLITRQPAAVSVMFNVEEMITMRDSVPLEIINIPPTVADVMNTGQIPITFSVPRSYTQKLVLDSLKAVLDLKGFERGTARILPSVVGLPPYSSVTKIDSVIVRL